MELIQRHLAWGRRKGKKTKTLWSSFQTFAICQPDHMLQQYFFNKSRILSPEYFKIWCRKHQLGKLQLWTQTANYKSRSKTKSLHQETSDLCETPKEWKRDAFSVIAKCYLAHPDPTSRPSAGCHTLPMHRSYIFQSQRIDHNTCITSLAKPGAWTLGRVGGKRWVPWTICMDEGE